MRFPQTEQHRQQPNYIMNYIGRMHAAILLF